MHIPHRINACSSLRMVDYVQEGAGKQEQAAA